ncbi:PPOX class F420-dependent oxidoreductase [Conexibacter sp. JD483]|uniref:PPOX class F420-dependent oxidoreductase n=1 Tax=unclassified Conexibacter TaxID=2627773 RepID=UPI0027248B74|nr:MULTISPECIES: PPOX class F420-dependent oxidoreductase [unclassified Conexibacter]MDO8188003.1 PPOX class F420-dependent oxidoreductase [Conexibacter sp. CPCC 205706]MDO8200886.1 PPOX class F420-dependent oxidoreductase [Conexibacter sp. CPCC 205762]MDR9370381.1 PPOX class F420-dependent oxidoreductase [Conexibacter sp. JD483]
MAQIEGRVRELLEQPNFCFVATVRADGTPHVTPVWVDVEGDEVVLNSAEGRAWPSNLERDPRATLTIADKDNQYEYVSIRGRLAAKTTDGADDHIDAMAKKYLGQDEYPFRQPGEERIILRFTPEKVHHNA